MATVFAVGIQVGKRNIEFYIMSDLPTQTKAQLSEYMPLVFGLAEVKYVDHNTEL